MLVKLREHGTVMLPEEVRDGLDNDALFDAVRRDDGVIELRPQGGINPSQRWYWSEQWQRMEQEARADYETGHFKRYENVEDFLTGLDTETE